MPGKLGGALWDSKGEVPPPVLPLYQDTVQVKKKSQEAGDFSKKNDLDFFGLGTEDYLK